MAQAGRLHQRGKVVREDTNQGRGELNSKVNVNKETTFLQS